jgi:hypothetical protein
MKTRKAPKKENDSSKEVSRISTTADLSSNKSGIYPVVLPQRLWAALPEGEQLSLMTLASRHWAGSDGYWHFIFDFAGFSAFLDSIESTIGTPPAASSSTPFASPALDLPHSYVHASLPSSKGKGASHG